MEPDDRLDALLEELAAHDRRASEGDVRRIWPQGWAPTVSRGPDGRQAPARRPLLLRPVLAAAAIAVAFLLGGVVGRWSRPAPEPESPLGGAAAAPTGAPSGPAAASNRRPPPADGIPRRDPPLLVAPAATRVAEVRERGTALLAQVQESSGMPAGIKDAARDLLWSTRRALDEPGGLGGEELALLGELEWLLVQLTDLDPASRPQDVAATRATIRSRDLIARLDRIQAGKAASE